MNGIMLPKLDLFGSNFAFYVDKKESKCEKFYWFNFAWLWIHSQVKIKEKENGWDGWFFSRNDLGYNCEFWGLLFLLSEF